jgi:hypothetical protein
MKHAMLHVVHPQIFPKESLHPHTLLQLSLSHLKIAPADTMLQVHFQPPSLRGLNRSKVVGLVDEEAITRPFIEDPVLSELLKKFREDCSLVGFPIEEKHRHRYEEAADTVMKKRGEFEVSFLGTGAAIPSRYRNVSSIYLSVHDYGSLLFDAGEGTYGQLIRLFGELGANQGDLSPHPSSLISLLPSLSSPLSFWSLFTLSINLLFSLLFSLFLFSRLPSLSSHWFSDRLSSLQRC